MDATEIGDEGCFSGDPKTPETNAGSRWMGKLSLAACTRRLLSSPLPLAALSRPGSTLNTCWAWGTPNTMRGLKFFSHGGGGRPSDAVSMWANFFCAPSLSNKLRRGYLRYQILQSEQVLTLVVHTCHSCDFVHQLAVVVRPQRCPIHS